MTTHRHQDVLVDDSTSNTSSTDAASARLSQQVRYTPPLTQSLTTDAPIYFFPCLYSLFPSRPKVVCFWTQRACVLELTGVLCIVIISLCHCARLWCAGADLYRTAGESSTHSSQAEIFLHFRSSWWRWRWCRRLPAGRLSCRPLGVAWRVIDVTWLTLWRQLLPYYIGTAIKHPVPDQVKPYVICNFWHPGTLTLRVECQSARMSKITNDGLIRSGTGCFIAVPVWP